MKEDPFHNIEKLCDVTPLSSILVPLKNLEYPFAFDDAYGMKPKSNLKGKAEQ